MTVRKGSLRGVKATRQENGKSYWLRNSENHALKCSSGSIAYSVRKCLLTPEVCSFSVTYRYSC